MTEFGRDGAAAALDILCWGRPRTHPGNRPQLGVRVRSAYASPGVSCAAGQCLTVRSRVAKPVSLPASSISLDDLPVCDVSHWSCRPVFSCRALFYHCQGTRGG